MCATTESPATQTSIEFIDNIIFEVRRGREFIPLIGSGLSGPSGILMGIEFAEYLAFTTHRALSSPPWNLRALGWPPYPRKHEMKEARDWIKVQYERVTATVESTSPSASLHGVRDLLFDLTRPLTPTVLADSVLADDTAVRQLRRALGRNPIGRDLPADDTTITSAEFITELGIRSLSDWRETLRFLSRLVVEHESVRLSTPDSTVIDRFNAHITRNRLPNLGHKMLAHLATPLRIRTILTTNFDDLLERAFKAYKVPLCVVPVSSLGRLPAAQIVRAQNTLVKMHGERLETRADLTLDDDPNMYDKATFASYFLPASIMSSTEAYDLGAGGGPRQPPCVIVIGYSASEARCTDLLKFLLDADAAGVIRVFWICFTENDVERVKRVFSGTDYIQTGRLAIHRSARPDLVLYELYQRLMLCLPPGGLSYEFAHLVPPVRFRTRCPMNGIDARTRRFLEKVRRGGGDIIQMALDQEKDLGDAKRLVSDTLVAEACEAIIDAVLRPEQQRPARSAFAPYLRVERLDSGCIDVSIARGATRALCLAFYDLMSKTPFNCIWLEMSDFSDIQSLANELIRTIALRVGQFPLQHVGTCPIPLEETDRGQLKKDWELQLGTELRVDPAGWVIFFYGRDVPGTSSGWADRPWDDTENRRLWKLFLTFLTIDIGFRVLNAGASKGRLKRKAEAVKRCIGEERWAPIRFIEKDRLPAKARTRNEKAAVAHSAFCTESYGTLSAFSTSPDPEELKFEGRAAELTIFPDIMRCFQESLISQTGDKAKPFRLKGGKARLRFLYALTLFRRARHPAALLTEACYQCPHRYNIVGIDNDWVRWSEALNWLNELEKANASILYEKPGGYIWLHRDVRLGFQRWMESLALQQLDGVDDIKHYFLGEVRARTHLWIGEWYFKAFAASADLTPVVESIYHFSQAIRFVKWARPSAIEYGGRSTQLVKYRCVLAKSSLMQILKMLKLARPWIKMWLASAEPGATWSYLPNGDLKWLAKNLTKWSKRVHTGLEADVNELLYKVAFELKGLGSAIRAEGGKLTGKQYVAPETVNPRKVVSIDPISHGLAWVLDRSLSARWPLRFKAIGAQSLLSVIETPLSAIDSPDAFDRSLSKAKASWLLGRSCNSQTMHVLLWLLAEYAYLVVRRSKLAFHAQKQINKENWRRVTVCCNVGLDLCKHLPLCFLHEEMLLRIKFHELYALALANLGRFFESHRHLNEAAAILTKAGHPTDAAELAIVSLRRAEVFLTECFWLNEAIDNIANASNESENVEGKWEYFGGAEWRSSPPACGPDTYEYANWVASETSDASAEPGFVILPAFIDRVVGRRTQTKELLLSMSSAVLDDAWIELDRAETVLAERSQSTLWWGRLVTLRLRVFGLLRSSIVARSSLVFRADSSSDAIALWFVRGSRITKEDPFRRLRTVEYFLDARTMYRQLFKKDVLSDYDGRVKDVIKQCELGIGELKKDTNVDDTLLTEYFIRVKNAATS